MDDRRFDDLTRSMATSRRGALKTLARLVAGGLLAAVAPTEGAARQRPPRPRGCRRRPDGVRCGQCGICSGGSCIPDRSKCKECHICDFDSLTCIQQVEGDICGECKTCQGGVCQVVPNGKPCANDGCVTCQDGACVGQAPAGTACGKECGTCDHSGFCEPNDARCTEQFTNDAECMTCNASEMICDIEARTGFPCSGGCGICQDGTCAPNNEGGACGACGTCQGLQCINEGDCGACGVCNEAAQQCAPDDTRCAECEICVQTLPGRDSHCEPAPVGTACTTAGGESGTCQGGVCVTPTPSPTPTPPPQACPPNLPVNCGVNFAGVLVCCDPTPPACESCVWSGTDWGCGFSPCQAGHECCELYGPS